MPSSWSPENKEKRKQKARHARRKVVCGVRNRESVRESMGKTAREGRENKHKKKQITIQT